MPWYKWSRTANTNASADPTINYAEGQAPSTLNDSARALMAASAMYRDDVAGAIVTAGTSTAYTVSSFSSFDSLSDMNGQQVWFTPHVTNGVSGLSGGVTLNVDGLGAKSLLSAPNTGLLAGVLVQGTPYGAVYNNTDGAWYLKSYFGQPYSIPLGGLVDFIGGTAPNSYFAFPQGQAISRTTYASLFNLVGTAYGSGDGSTTFNLPNLQGRVVAMLDGTGSVMTAGSMSPNGNTLGATGGSQSHTLTLAEIPTGITSNGSASVSAPNGQNFVTGTGTEVINYAGGSTSRTIVNNSTVLANSAIAGGTASVTSNNTGGGAHLIVQPTIMLNKILRII